VRNVRHRAPEIQRIRIPIQRRVSIHPVFTNARTRARMFYVESSGGGGRGDARGKASERGAAAHNLRDAFRPAGRRTPRKAAGATCLAERPFSPRNGRGPSPFGSQASGAFYATPERRPRDMRCSNVARVGLRTDSGSISEASCGVDAAFTAQRFFSEHSALRTPKRIFARHLVAQLAH